MAQNLLIEIQIQDNQALARVNGLQDSFENLETTIAKVEAELGKMNKASNGTVSAYGKQIKALEELRDETAKTNKQYRAQTEEINKLKNAQNAISGPMKGSVGDLMEQRNALIAQQKATARTTAQFDKYQKKIIAVQGKIDILSGATTRNVRVNEDLISNAGLAGATLTEVGRTLSDLPYGIRGVANNLSQLSTLFVTLISKTDGATNAFRLLGNQLKGPLGLILAFQAALAALDFFFGGVKKAEEATDDLTDSLEQNLNILNLLEKSLKNNNKALRERDELVNALASQHSTLKKILEDENLTLEERRKKAGEFLNLEQQRLSLQDEMSKKEKDLSTAIDEHEKVQARLNKQNEKDKDLSVFTAGYAKIQQADLLKESSLTQQINKLLKEKNDKSEEYFDILIKLHEIKKSLEPDGFDFFVADDIEIIDDLNTATKEFFESIKEYLEIQKLLGDEPLLIPELRENAFDADQFINQIVDLNRFRTQFTSLTESQIIDIQEQSALEQFGILTQGLENVVDIETEKQKILDFFAQKRKDLRNSELQQALSEVQELINGMSDAMAMLSDAELSREERKTVLLNNELKERLRNENLSVKEREKLNKQIEANELALQQKRDEIAERNFKLQKAFAIAQAVINTALAVSDVLAREKGGLIKKSVAAVAIGVLGAAQVAAIASTKFVPTATSAPSGAAGISGGSSAPAQQEPVFNIVGTGTQMQLAETVAQRTGEPIKAYVVSNDVSTAQELDRNIITGSAIG
jgi:chromosome segregation ATPase